MAGMLQHFRRFPDEMPDTSTNNTLHERTKGYQKICL